MKLITATILALFATGLTFAQSEPKPKFDAADIHSSAKTPNPFPRTAPVRGGRYEIKTATMVDLIRIAYGFSPDKILGGPNWLEMDLFDITAKVPADSTPETHKLMLQSLLEDRFKLAVHTDTKPLPTYALTAGKKLVMKEATGSEESGCKPQTSSAAPQEGGVRLFMSSSNGGAPVTLNLGPGMTVTYNCRNMTMAAFASGLRTMMMTGAQLGSNPILEETGLKGAWNFDLRYSMSLNGPMMGETSDRVSIFTALEKQAGLKLEERPVPTPVIVVDSVERKPSANPPETAEALPPLPVPTEFEVATIKPVGATNGPMMSRFQMQPGGRLVSEGMPLRFLISRAFNTNNNEQVQGVPPFAMTDRYDIIAKVPGTAGAGPIDNDAMAPLLLKLLVERFKMTYHTEDREVQTFSLVAGKPKLKKADPASRSSCKNANAPQGSPQGSRMLTCTNVTIAQFADRLQSLTPDLPWPVPDETGIEGSWDINLVFNMRPMMATMMGAGMPVPPPPPPGGGGMGMAVGMAGGGPGGGPGGGGTASDPSGGQTIFEAIEKQLGLKLEKQKRSMPVFVIDRMEQKPTDN
jgi:uncharacterized protein (TIGR03435 family)